MTLLARLLPAAVLVAAASLLTDCTGASVLNALQPGLGVRQVHDVAYAEGPRHRLDVYAPESVRGGAPVVVFLYGGSWDSGDKDMYAFVGKALAARGIVAVIPDYRVYPEARYPAFLRDNAAALRWARDHAGTYGGDPHKLVLMGHSAGAYNAAMLALDRRWLGDVGMRPDRDLSAVIGLAGPYDFLPLDDETLEEIFAPAPSLKDTQPINHVGQPVPPVFLGAARGDDTVSPRNTRVLAAALRTSGASVEERYYDGLSHALLIGTLGDPVSLLAPVRDDVVAFIRRSTGEAAR